MDLDGSQDVNLPPDHFDSKNSSLLSEYAPSSSLPVVISLLSLHSTQVASMAEFDSDQLSANESSDESIQPESKLSELSTSTSSLTSLVSSVSLDYLSCEDAPISGEQSSEPQLVGPELEEPVPPLNDENWPSIVEIYSPRLSIPSSLLLCLIDHCIQADVQINEHAPDRPCSGATLVIWDPTRSGSFQPTSCTSMIPKWWRSLAGHF